MSTKHFFVCGNTAKGFYNFFENNLQSLIKVYILKGGPGTGKSTMMKRIGKEFEEFKYDVEYMHCSSDPDSLDGIIIPKLGVGIVDGTAPHVIEPKIPGAIEEYINLGVSWDVDKLKIHIKEISNLQSNIKQCYEKAYLEFAKGLKVHDEWEEIYIKNMNFERANKLTEEVITKLLGSTYLNKTSSVKERFFGGSTPYGAMDFVENITSGIGRRYFIKGRPGSGKSTMLKKILEKAKNSGIDVEVYRCGFDPDSLDMLLFPELNLCIFDSTSPHEYFPSRDGDSVIDMYEKLININTDEINKTKLEDIVERYKSCTNKGIGYLNMAKVYHDELEKFYIQATDFKVIDGIYNGIYEKIIRYHKSV